MSLALASDVRDHFRSDKSRQKGLSKAAKHTLKPGAKGRIHPDARVLYAEQTGADYTEGNQSVVEVDGVQFTWAEAREAARQAGVAVGERGPLKGEALDAAVLALKG